MLNEVWVLTASVLVLGILLEFLAVRGHIKINSWGVRILGPGYFIGQAYLIWLVLGDLAALTSLLVSFYRLVNIARLGVDEQPGANIKKRALRSAWCLGLLQLAIFLVPVIFVAYFTTQDDLLLKMVLAVLLSTQFTVGVTALLLAFYYIRLYSTKTSGPGSTKLKHPTVSLLIPARNETGYLEPCLEAALASDYPKLEILVLDDCSHDNMSQIIKDFAHRGVRFIAGKEVPDNWLAKNFAYQQLFDSSSGQILFFMGVDARLAKGTISSIVERKQATNVKMLSILPTRGEQSLLNTLVQPIRYWLEIALPKPFSRRPPVISTCWLIDKEALKKLGGFRSVARSILPEALFARTMAKSKQYSFWTSKAPSTVWTYKNLADQFDTAVRTRYPLLRKRPENVLAFSLFEAFVLLLPFFSLPMVLMLSGLSYLSIVNLAAAALLALSHALINRATRMPFWQFSFFSLPLILLIDLAVVHISMFRYEFSSVVWKERNICLPVMRRSATLHH